LFDQFSMATDQRWKWAGIVSVVSVAGVLITDIVANIVGEYISDQIKASWLMPGQEAPAIPASEPQADIMVSSISAAPERESQAQLAADTAKPLTTETVAVREPVAEPEPVPDAEPELETDIAVAPRSIPPPPPLELPPPPLPYSWLP